MLHEQSSKELIVQYKFREYLMYLIYTWFYILTNMCMTIKLPLEPKQESMSQFKTISINFKASSMYLNAGNLPISECYF